MGRPSVLARRRLEIPGQTGISDNFKSSGIGREAAFAADSRMIGSRDWAGTGHPAGGILFSRRHKRPGATDNVTWIFTTPL
jgi:hypothetical protein